jgi:glycosyltransferase involved in cell wall biosynthesis
VIDVRTVDDSSGGIQQWVIGLAAALSNLSYRSEEYLFLVNEGQGDWLLPYLGGRCKVVVQRKVNVATPAMTPAPALDAGHPRRRSGLGARFPVLRTIRRRVLGRKPGAARPPRLSPFDETMADLDADVVHFPKQSASTTTLPNIYQPWDLQHRHLPEFFSAEVLEQRDATYRRYCAQATLIIVSTTWTRDDVAAEYGIAPERIAAIHPPPPTRMYVQPTPDAEESIATRLGLPARFALYPALAWPHKNHERLFEALGMLRDRGIEVPLVCSGHRNDRYPALMQRAGELGIESLVTFPGFLTEAEIQVVYRRATMLVFPSLYEGGSFPILEAFAAGLPVACSNVTSLPALVGDAAIVFEPTDPAAIAAAIERLWFDEALAGQLVERGRARVLQFDWDRTARLMRAHYRRIGSRRLTAAERRLLAAPPLV